MTVHASLVLLRTATQVSLFTGSDRYPIDSAIQMSANLINNSMDTEMTKSTIWTLTRMSGYLRSQLCPHPLKHLLMPNTMGQHSSSALQWELQELPFPIWVQMYHVSKYCATIWDQKTSGTRSNHSMIGNLRNGQKTEVHLRPRCPNYWQLMACVHSNSDIELITNVQLHRWSMSRPLPWWVLHGRGCALH